jgi:hypothetical protein
MSILDEAVAAAGVDPRELHALLMAGQPERTIELARAFETAGREARETYERGRRAHGTIADGFGNNGVPVLDAQAQSTQAWRLLGQGGQDMEDTAAFLKRSVGALDEAQASRTRAVNRMVAELNVLASRATQIVAPDPAAAAAARGELLAQAARVVTAAAGEVQRTIDTYDRGLSRDAAELAARGYAPATPARPTPRAVGHTTPRHQRQWWESALDTAGDVGAEIYNHTVVPLVNGAADLGQAALEHPEDVAGLLLGGGMILLGGGGEVGGVALDATGVGAVAWVPINAAAAGVIAAGAGIAAMSAGDLGSNAANNDNHVLDEVQGPSASQPKPGDPLPESARPDTAGGDWKGRVANNGQGEVWQKPENVNPPKGTPPNANSVRIGEPNAQNPTGYVRFYNEHGQPIRLDGKPGGPADTHIPIRPDGSYDVPQGWNP